jgi:hypothetical protein
MAFTAVHGIYIYVYVCIYIYIYIYIKPPSRGSRCNGGLHRSAGGTEWPPTGFLRVSWPPAVGFRATGRLRPCSCGSCACADCIFVSTVFTWLSLLLAVGSFSSGGGWAVAVGARTVWRTDFVRVPRHYLLADCPLPWSQLRRVLDA